MPRVELSAGMVVRAVGLALGYLTAGLLGIALSPEVGSISVFWPANALLVGALLRTDLRDCPLILAACATASVTAHLLQGDAVGFAVALAAANMLNVWCGYRLIARLAGPTFRVADLRELFVLLAASLIAPAAGATAAALIVGSSLGGSASALWWTSWARDSLGMVLFLPLIAGFEVAPAKRLLFGPRDWRLLAVTLELLIACGFLLAALGLIISGSWYGSPTLFAPPLLWIALRFGIWPTAAAAATIGALVVVAVAHDMWPLPVAPDARISTQMLSLQLRVILVTLPPLVVAVMVAERAWARRQLDDAIESMADALALYDRQGRLVLTNRRYPEFFPRIADLLVPGVHYEDIVREGTRRGVYHGVEAADSEAWVAAQVAAHRAGAASELQLDDGRWLHAIARRTADGGTVDVRRDVTERKLLEQAVLHMAMHDPLTNLPNRALFYNELERALARAQREAGLTAVMILDLDHFKEVNDTHGHTIGDRLLQEIAGRLLGCVRGRDLVARLGGDEFGVIAENRDGSEGLKALAGRIVDRLNGLIQVGGIEIEAGASLGMTIFPDDLGGPDELVANADRALYAAKDAGRRTWVQFRKGMRAGTGDSLRLADELGGALERGEFDLDYQPIVAIRSFEVVGVEALLRWNHPRRGRLPASGFILAAERTTSILPLTRFVIRRALGQQRAWRAAGVGDLKVWVNLAAPCLRWEGLIDAITRELAASNVAPSRLVLEVTESSFIDLERAEHRIKALHLVGVGLALDDFGTSYSSLGRLRSLPMDVVKIDRAFIADLARDERDRAVVRTMVALGENLNLTPTAEGVETVEQLRVLRGLGCVWAQGHLFARPMPPLEFPSWLAAWEERRQLDPHQDFLRHDADGGVPA
jgi:diguanylate cyclase (GGDEF)-like protein